MPATIPKEGVLFPLQWVFLHPRMNTDSLTWKCFNPCSLKIFMEDLYCRCRPLWTKTSLFLPVGWQNDAVEPSQLLIRVTSPHLRDQQELPHKRLLPLKKPHGTEYLHCRCSYHYRNMNSPVLKNLNQKIWISNRVHESKKDWKVGSTKQHGQKW